MAAKKLKRRKSFDCLICAFRVFSRQSINPNFVFTKASAPASEAIARRNACGKQFPCSDAKVMPEKTQFIPAAKRPDRWSDRDSPPFSLTKPIKIGDCHEWHFPKA
jgi:hypothetical protein